MTTEARNLGPPEIVRDRAVNALGYASRTLSFGAEGGGTAAITWYTMRAVDANAATTPPTYRTWRVKDNPDYVGAQYTGPYSGGSPNLTSVTIQSEVTL